MNLEQALFLLADCCPDAYREILHHLLNLAGRGFPATAEEALRTAKAYQDLAVALDPQVPQPVRYEAVVATIACIPDAAFAGRSGMFTQRVIAQAAMAAYRTRRYGNARAGRALFALAGAADAEVEQRGSNYSKVAEELQ